MHTKPDLLKRMIYTNSEVLAGCLDRAIMQTTAGEAIDPSLATIVDGVMRGSSGENGKLVSYLRNQLA